MNIHRRLWNWCRKPLRPGSTSFVRLVTPLYVSVLIGGLLLATYAAVVLLPPISLFSSSGSVKSFEWTDICHGAVAAVYLTTDALWVTNYSRKITFLFSVQSISGYSNATTSYDNSYIVLNSVRLDPSYVNKSEFPSKKLLDKEAWSVDWYFTPRADDFVLSCMEISRGKYMQYSLFLEVDYTVVDSEAVEWSALFQNWATMTIVGGDDAP